MTDYEKLSFTLEMFRKTFQPKYDTLRHYNDKRKNWRKYSFIFDIAEVTIPSGADHLTNIMKISLDYVLKNLDLDVFMSTPTWTRVLDYRNGFIKIDVTVYNEFFQRLTIDMCHQINQSLTVNQIYNTLSTEGD